MDDTFHKALIKALQNECTELKKVLMQNVSSGFALIVPMNKHVAGHGFLAEYRRLHRALKYEKEYGPVVPFSPESKNKGEDLLIQEFFSDSIREKDMVKPILTDQDSYILQGRWGEKKKQTLVSLLMNAWIHQKKILFFPSGEGRIHECRQEVEKLMGDIPAMVVAGPPEARDVESVLEHIQNLLTEKGLQKSIRNGALQQKHDLLETVDRLKRYQGNLSDIEQEFALLESISREAKTIKEEKDTAQNALEKEALAMGHDGSFQDFAEKMLQPLYPWLHELEILEQKCLENSTLKKKYEGELQKLNEEISKRCTILGIDDDEVFSSLIPLQEEPLGEIRSLLERVHHMLSENDEAFFYPKWNEVYDEWHTLRDLQSWLYELYAYKDRLIQSCEKCKLYLIDIEHNNSFLNEMKEILEMTGLSEAFQLPESILKNWLSNYQEYHKLKKESPSPMKKIKLFVWENKLRLVEKRILSLLNENNAKVLKKEFKNRERLKEKLRQARLYIRRKLNIENLYIELEYLVGALKKKGMELNVDEVCPMIEGGDFKGAIHVLEEKIETGEEALAAWQHRNALYDFGEILRIEINRLRPTIARHELFEAWFKHIDVETNRALLDLNQEVKYKTIEKAKQCIQKVISDDTFKAFNEIASLQKERLDVQIKMENVPEEYIFIKDWWQKKPPSLHLFFEEKEVLKPKLFKYKETGERLQDKIEEYLHDFTPVYQKKQKEKKEAMTKVEDRIKTQIPEELRERNREEEFIYSLDKEPYDFEPDYFFSCFIYLKETLNNEIERFIHTIESLLCAAAKENWFLSLEADVKKQYDLERIRQKLHKQKKVLSTYDARFFQSVLETIPIWVATPQHMESIPLIVHQFDILIVDDAEKIQLEWILPMLFRVKKIVALDNGEHTFDEEIALKRFQVGEREPDIKEVLTNMAWESNSTDVKGGLPGSDIFFGTMIE